jgi:hypothetical protein
VQELAGIGRITDATGEAEPVNKNGSDMLRRVRVLIHSGLRYVTFPAFHCGFFKSQTRD